jgi:hypothetical protein
VQRMQPNFSGYYSDDISNRARYICQSCRQLRNASRVMDNTKRLGYAHVSHSITSLIRVLYMNTQETDHPALPKDGAYASHVRLLTPLTDTTLCDPRFTRLGLPNDRYQPPPHINIFTKELIYVGYTVFRLLEQMLWANGRRICTTRVTSYMLRAAWLFTATPNNPIRDMQ